MNGSLTCPWIHYRISKWLKLHPSEGAYKFSAIQELLYSLRNPYVHYHVHKSPSTCSYTESDESSPCPPILLPWSPFQYYPAIYTCTCSFPMRFATKILHAFLFSPMRITCPSKLIILYLITLIICGEKYKHEAPNSAFSPVSSQVLSPSYVQKSSSASLSWTLSYKRQTNK